MRKIISILILSLVLTLAACATDEGESQSESNGSNEDGTSLGLVEPGKLTFAASGEFKPFSYMEGTDMVGYDVAVGKAIAEKLGLEPNPKRAKFSGIVTGVSEGRYDVAVASHTITEDRLEQVDFTEPYYYSGPVVWVQPGSDIKTESDLEGKKIAVARGTTYITIAEEYTDDIPQLDSDVVALQSLANGSYDAVITDDVTGNAAIDNGLEIEEAFYLGVSEQGIAVNKDNQNLTEEINAILQEMKESGELKELAEEWIGTDITVEPEATSE